ncbi:CHAD domain-containing protein [Paeniroseomonas aquatica]|uniref:CHAD domain-containing protein n=1 Tax=Paeniroseomonas aquatica TaxID=373043 RepID=A0ABT8AA90_9PROT|nr:CHAD domain-containing protein [Paeniroseomonas aquatica]MDN3566585.1 CHAD domain-containing protein [Paeniroseomonas aquatica]
MPPPAEPDPPATTPASVSLEFALDPAAAQRLPRHAAIATARAGRSRSLAEELIWLDTAEGSLAAAGLALAAPAKGERQLLRSMPAAGQAWRPGTPAEPVPPRDGLPPEDAALVPIAAFSGRRSLMQLGEVEAELLAGKLRAVAAETPVARLRLTGPAEAVLARAAALAADLHLLPATASLAEEGRALARGEAPRPRRRGAPALADAGTVEAALQAALGHLLEAMLSHAPGCRPGAGMEGVHQTRVALRRLRSVLKSFRPAAGCPAVAGFDAGLAALAGALGPARDWDVFLAGTAAAAAEAIGPDRRLAALLKAAEARRAESYDSLGRLLDGPAFPRLVLAGLSLMLLRPWREGAEADGRAALLDQPLAEFGAGLLDKRWQRLRKRGEAIEAHGAEALHEVRLDAKRLRYAAELFAPLWPGKAARRFLRRLAALQEELGVANDTAVARALVASLAPGAAAEGSRGRGGAVPGWAVGAMEGFAAGRSGRARRHALDAWDSLLQASPFWR